MVGESKGSDALSSESSNTGLQLFCHPSTISKLHNRENTLQNELGPYLSH